MVKIPYHKYKIKITNYEIIKLIINAIKQQQKLTFQY